MPAIARSPLSAVLVLSLIGRGVQAQTTYPSIKVTGRLQEQFYYFDNDSYAPGVGPQSTFLLRRARVEARGDIAENGGVAAERFG